MESIIYVLKNCNLLVWEQGQRTLELMIEMPTLLAPMNGSIMKLNAGRSSTTLDETRMVLLRPGDSVVINACEGQGQPSVCQVLFECYQLAELDEEKLVYRNDRSSLPVSGWVREKLPYRANVLLKELLRVQGQHHDSLSDKRQQGRLLKELLQLTLGDGPGPDINREPSIQEAVSYITTHYQSRITRSEIARLAGFNVSYFSTLFTKRMGWGFSEYLNRVRVDRAKEHLMTSSLSVNEIATRVGYTNGEYLSRKFKQLTGMSPGEFRNRPVPKRIAAFQFVGDLLALGIKPVVIDAELARGTLLLQNELRDVAIVNGAYEDEQLDQLEADLIIAPDYFYNMPGRMKRLEQIAPVIALEWGKLDPLTELQFMGRLLHKEQEAGRWIVRYHERVEQAKHKLQGVIARGETAAVYEVRDDGIFIWDRTARGAFNLYDSLNLHPPELVRRDVLEPGRHLWITEEALAEYAADHMFIVLARSGSCAFPDWLAHSSDWQSLPAARKGRLYPLKLEEFWCSDGLALERQLEVQVEWLLSSESTEHLSIKIDNKLE
ncbi:helix-turn-helix domain-containing protein [Paenibacillaceae bacterium]|nr:helix-turn-helix domain-containing protein [Paenibacillaceae bacterium]